MTGSLDRRTLEGYLLVAGAMALVGTTVIASKLVAADWPPFTATALRFAIALPIFLVLMAATRTSFPRPSRSDAALLVVQAGAGSVGYTVFLIAGLVHTSAANAGVIVGTLPVAAAAFSILALGERPRPATLVAILVATGGVLAVSIGANGGGGAGGVSGALLGNLLILAAIFCEVLFILLNKRLATPIKPLALSTIMTGIGLVLAGIPALLFENPFALEASTPALWAVVYFAIGPTVLGFVLWYAGAARVTGAEASLFTAVAPVTAVALAAAVLGEAITLAQALGVACVVAAVAAMTLGAILRTRRASSRV